MILYIVTLHFVGVHIILAVDSIYTTHNKSINQLNVIMRQSNNKDVDSKIQYIDMTQLTFLPNGNVDNAAGL